jgi:hypothetical protein
MTRIFPDCYLSSSVKSVKSVVKRKRLPYASDPGLALISVRLAFPIFALFAFLCG